jgi:hypothetical protein
MRSTRSAWGWSVGAVVLLVGGLMIADYGPAATPAAAAPPVDEDPNAGVTKNWDKKLPNTSRFTVLTDFGGAAMRDNETGLVWEQSPETKTQNWSGARFQLHAPHHRRTERSLYTAGACDFQARRSRSARQVGAVMALLAIFLLPRSEYHLLESNANGGQKCR